MERFKYRNLFVYLTIENVITIRRYSRTELNLRIRKVESLFPPNFLVNARLGFSKERAGYGTQFFQFVTQVSRKNGLNHIGIECANSKSCMLTPKFGFYFIDSSNLSNSEYHKMICLSNRDINPQVTRIDLYQAHAIF